MMFYSIFYNNSLEEDMFISGFYKPTPRDPVMIQLKVSIDNALIKHLGKEKGMAVDELWVSSVLLKHVLFVHNSSTGNYNRNA